MENITEQFRTPIKELFGMDISEATLHYSTRSYVYVFPTEYIIRINLDEENADPTVREAELNFLSDINRYCDTVCASIPSINKKSIEHISMDKKSYSIIKTLKAKGDIVSGPALNAHHAERVGDVLGHIHQASKESAQKGLTYHRPTWLTIDGVLHENIDSEAFAPYLDFAARAKLKQTAEKVKALTPVSSINYGMIHGDFTHYNYYVDGEDIWVFDFDDCQYGYYMYDIGTLFINWLLRADAGVGLSSEEFLSQLLPAFRQGYERHMKLDENEWNLLELFMQYRLLIMILDSIYSLITQTGKIGGTTNTLAILPSILNPFMASDLCKGIDQQAEEGRRKREKIMQLLQNGPNPDSPEDMAMMKFLESDDMKPFIEGLLKS